LQVPTLAILQWKQVSAEVTGWSPRYSSAFCGFSLIHTIFRIIQTFGKVYIHLRHRRGLNKSGYLAQLLIRSQPRIGRFHPALSRQDAVFIWTKYNAGIKPVKRELKTSLSQLARIGSVYMGISYLR
jgi:hypothetical protein